MAALDAATASAASYADVRVVESESEALAVRGPQVEALDRSRSQGIGVRVLLDGAWGYAASARLDRASVQRAAATAVEVARASATARSTPVELVPEPPTDEETAHAKNQFEGPA